MELGWGWKLIFSDVEGKKPSYCEVSILWGPALWVPSSPLLLLEERYAWILDLWKTQPAGGEGERKQWDKINYSYAVEWSGRDLSLQTLYHALRRSPFSSSSFINKYYRAALSIYRGLELHKCRRVVRHVDVSWGCDGKTKYEKVKVEELFFSRKKL